MKALHPNNFNQLSPGVQKVIDRQTRDEIFFGTPMPHSYQTLCRQGRALAIATRIRTTVTPLYDEVRVVNNKFILTGAQRNFTGDQIARTYVEDVRNFGHTYFPLNGVIKGEISQLILFTKASPEDKYLPFARFITDAPFRSTEITAEQANYFSDPTIIKNTTFQSLIPIRCPETQDLPPDFLSTYSAESVYDRSFKGGQSIIFVI